MRGAFKLPVRSGVRVERLFKRDGRYVVRAGALELRGGSGRRRHGEVPARKDARVRCCACHAEITQLHSNEYRNLSQLRPGGVLLAGGGNSGADIRAGELPRAGHETWIAGRDNGQIPFRPERFWGRNLLGPLVIGFVFRHVLTVKTPLGRKARPVVLSKAAR